MALCNIKQNLSKIVLVVLPYHHYNKSKLFTIHARRYRDADMQHNNITVSRYLRSIMLIK